MLWMMSANSSNPLFVQSLGEQTGHGGMWSVASKPFDDLAGDAKEVLLGGAGLPHMKI